MSLEGLISVAKGAAPADLLLTRARIVNTFTAEVEEGNVAIYGDRIAGIGDYGKGKKVIDLEGKYLIPGFIDGHTHVESSNLHLPEYAKAVVSRGTTALVTDLHEIANVVGLKGVRYLLDCARRLPLDVFLMLPSCVPVTTLETSGAQLSAQELRRALRWKGVIGLGEVMNFPGVIECNHQVLAKIRLFPQGIRDGHAPHFKGKALNAYLAAGITSDHECTSLEEAKEKLRRGMHIMIREGSSEKNLDDLLPLVTEHTYPRCFFVVDDCTAVDLFRDGDMDAVVRKAIRRGLNPIRAIQMATINTARYFHLDDMGAIAPGYIANLAVMDDLRQCQAEMVFHHGKLVAQEGQPLFSTPPHLNEALTHTMNIKTFTVADLALPATKPVFPVIEVMPSQIITRKREEQPKVEEGLVRADIARDILKLVVVERHRASGNIGRGLVKGFGLKRGALASSLAHDSHNIIAVGTCDEDIYAAVKELERLQGGLVVTAQGIILGTLALPIAGLLAAEPLATVANKLEELQKLAAQLGTKLPSPFATLSFLALPVIPELRLTDKGLVEVAPGSIASWSGTP